MDKTCSKCKEEKNVSEFNSHKSKRSRKDGLYSWCKKCKYDDNRKRRKESRANNPRVKLDHRISNNISRALKGRKHRRSWKDLLGYSVDNLFEHLESQFKEGMTWENYGKVWHIDHVVPKSFFKYEDCDEVFKACWALENLQPMFAEENRLKSNKVANPFL